MTVLERPGVCPHQQLSIVPHVIHLLSSTSFFFMQLQKLFAVFLGATHVWDDAESDRTAEWSDFLGQVRLAVDMQS